MDASDEKLVQRSKMLCAKQMLSANPMKSSNFVSTRQAPTWIDLSLFALIMRPFRGFVPWMKVDRGCCVPHMFSFLTQSSVLWGNGKPKKLGISTVSLITRRARLTGPGTLNCQNGAGSSVSLEARHELRELLVYFSRQLPDSGC